MALGVQLYVVTTGDRGALERWLGWIETHRPCLVKSPRLSGKEYCLVRGWPRWCTDDTEKGCTAKPQNLALLARTARRLEARIPPPAEDKVPGGAAGAVLKELQKQSREANAALSLGALMVASEELQPIGLLVDASVNRAGYPRHLAGTEILLMRRLGYGSADVDLAARVLAEKEPLNPFFQYLWTGPTDAVAARVLAIAPRDSESLPATRSDWAWQRATGDEAWRKANLWDFVFIGRLLDPTGEGE